MENERLARPAHGTVRLGAGAAVAGAVRGVVAGWKKEACRCGVATEGAAGLDCATALAAGVRGRDSGAGLRVVGTSAGKLPPPRRSERGLPPDPGMAPVGAWKSGRETESVRLLPSKRSWRLPCSPSVIDVLNGDRVHVPMRCRRHAWSAECRG